MRPSGYSIAARRVAAKWRRTLLAKTKQAISVVTSGGGGNRTRVRKCYISGHHVRLRRFESGPARRPPMGSAWRAPGYLSPSSVQARRRASLNRYAQVRRLRQGPGWTALDRFLGGQRELNVVVGFCGFAAVFTR